MEAWHECDSYPEEINVVASAKGPASQTKCGMIKGFITSRPNGWCTEGERCFSHGGNLNIC